MQLIGFLLARFSEPSSYAGLGAVLALAGWHFSDSDVGQIVQFVAAGCGLAALLLKERGLLPATVLAVTLGTMLGACAPAAGIGGAAGGVALADALAGVADTAIQAGCAVYRQNRSAADAAVGASVVPADAAGKIGIIEQYGDAACADPPAGDALGTAIWLGELVGQIGSLASVAAPAT